MAVSLNDFLDLLSCNYTVNYNVFDHMENSVLKEEERCTIEDKIFPACGFIPRLFQIRDQLNAPVLLNTVLGLYWIVAVTGSTQTDSTEESSENFPDNFRVHVLGPIAEYPFEQSEAAGLLNQYLGNIPYGENAAVIRALMRIPVIPALAANQYALMFYYCLSGHKCSLSNIIHMEQDLRGSILDTAGRASVSTLKKNWISQGLQDTFITLFTIFPANLRKNAESALLTMSSNRKQNGQNCC